MKMKMCTVCRCLIPNDRGSPSRCPKHVRPAFQHASRSNEMLYKTPEWRALRKRILERDRVCSQCGCDSDLHVHHKIPPKGDKDLFYQEANLVLLCSSCHRVVTAREIRTPYGI